MSVSWTARYAYGEETTAENYWSRWHCARRQQDSYTSISYGRAYCGLISYSDSGVFFKSSGPGYSAQLGDKADAHITAPGKDPWGLWYLYLHLCTLGQIHGIKSLIIGLHHSDIKAIMSSCIKSLRHVFTASTGCRQTRLKWSKT